MTISTPMIFLRRRHGRRACLLFVCLPALGLAPVCEGVEYEVGGIVIKSRQKAVRIETPGCPHGTDENGEHPHIRYSFKSSTAVYELKYDRKSDGGNFGIRKPTFYNWYRGGAFMLRVNGEKFAPTPDRLIDKKMTEGDRGIVKFSWRADFGKVTYRFTLPAHSRGLRLRIELEPRQKIQSLELRLVNSPGGFGGGKATRHARLMRMRGRTARAGEVSSPVRFNPRRNHRLLFLNDKLDVATNAEADGPSALAFDPAGVRQARTFFDFFVSTRLTYEPEVRRMRLVFWELPGMTNQQATDWFRQRIGESIKTLFPDQNAP